MYDVAYPQLSVSNSYYLGQIKTTRLRLSHKRLSRKISCKTWHAMTILSSPPYRIVFGFVQVSNKASRDETDQVQCPQTASLTPPLIPASVATRMSEPQRVQLEHTLGSFPSQPTFLRSSHPQHTDHYTHAKYTSGTFADGRSDPRFRAKWNTS